MIYRQIKFCTDINKKAFRSRSWGISKTHPRTPRPCVSLQTKRENELFFAHSFKFSSDLSANRRAGRERKRKCDSAKDSSGKPSKAMELLK